MTLSCVFEEHAPIFIELAWRISLSSASRRVPTENSVRPYPCLVLGSVPGILPASPQVADTLRPGSRASYCSIALLTTLPLLPPKIAIKSRWTTTPAHEDRHVARSGVGDRQVLNAITIEVCERGGAREAADRRSGARR